MLVPPLKMLYYGLDFQNIRYDRWSLKKKVEEFHAHYGSAPKDLADQWNDLCEDDGTCLNTERLKMSEKEKSEKGLRRFAMAHYWI